MRKLLVERECGYHLQSVNNVKRIEAVKVNDNLKQVHFLIISNNEIENERRNQRRRNVKTTKVREMSV